MPFMATSPGVGIFRFFLLFVCSKESYPSTDDVAEGGGSGFEYFEDIDSGFSTYLYDLPEESGEWRG
jgi:hypothetical protein